jgi:RHH-type rel operon transcriptional repressor/antitoxin RelB
MTLSIRLSDADEKQLEQLARETGQSKEFHVQQFIRQGLEDIEDYNLAAEIAKRVRNGEEAVYSLAEVRKDLGLDD